MLQLDEGVQVDVEPFELFESTAWALVRASVLAHEAALAPAERGGSDGGAPFGYDAVFSNVRSHRVLLPAWVVQYPHLLERFRVFVNGATGDAAGVQQFSPLVALTRLGSLDASGLAANVDAVARALRAAQRVLPPQMVVALLNGALALARPLFKVLLWPPLLVASAATLGVFALSSAMRHRQQRAELAAWEEQRAVERRLQATMTDEWRFKPQGEAAWERARSARARRRRRRARTRRARASSSSSSSSSGHRRRRCPARRRRGPSRPRAPAAAAHSSSHGSRSRRPWTRATATPCWASRPRARPRRTSRRRSGASS